jgi:transposase, IS5 family
MKSDGHLGRWHLKGREGDAINVILTAVGHNLRRVLAWLRSSDLNPDHPPVGRRALSSRQAGFLTGDIFVPQKGE